MPRSRPRARVLLMTAAAGFVAVAGPVDRPVSGSAQRLLVLEDYFHFVNISEVVVAPSGDRVVFTRADIDRDSDARGSSIWAVGVDGSESTQLAADASAPQFAPDGAHLAFLREGQIWLLPTAGGEAWRLTSVPTAVSAFSWAPDSLRLVAVVREPPVSPGPLLPVDQQAPDEPARQPTLPAEPDPTPPPLDAGDWVPTEPAPEAVEPEAFDESGDVAEPAAATGSALVITEDAAGYPVGEVLDVADRDADPAPRAAVITRLQFKADGEGYVGVRPQHLFVVDVPATPGVVPARRLTGGRFSAGSPDWSPDGRWVAFSSNRTEQPDTNNDSDIWIVAAAGSDPVRVTDSAGADGSPSWSPGGTHIVYRHTPADPPVYANDVLRLVEVAPRVDSGRLQITAADPVELTAHLDRPLASNPQWAASRTAVYVAVQDRGMVSLVQVSTGLAGSDSRRGRRRAPPVPAGVAAAVISGPRAVGAFDVLPGGDSVTAVLSSGTAPPELYRVPARPRRGAIPMVQATGHVSPTSIPAAAELVPLTDLNGPWRSRVALGEPEPIRFHSTDDTVIEGWLLRPHGYQDGIRYPLIVRIHGGPVAQFSWAFSWERQWLAAQGYAVMYVNPRGSSGYGQDFAHALWGDWGGPDLDDVLAGVDHLVGRGIAHPERVGVGGWSYGGILTNYMVTRSDRFAAAISGASETDYFSCYGTDDLQRWWEDELGLPYDPESRATYANMSPIYDVAEIDTPTLFMVGEHDYRVPAAQSEQMYAQLRRRMVDGGPETGLIVYPDESHGISRPSFIIDRWLRYRAWYDRYLKNDPSADPFFGLRAW